MSDELMELPEGWEWIKLSDVAEKVGSGATPRGGSESYKAEGIPLIRSMNVHFNGLKLDGLAYLDDKQANELKNVEVKENDVLLNITGASIGRVTQAPDTMEGARVNQHVCIIRTHFTLDTNFLSRYLASPIVQGWIMAEEYGATRQALTKQMILNFDIPLPPLNEQKRIVAKIEELRERSQKARSHLSAIPNLCDKFRQSVLAAAFRGDLTADWREQNPDVEPASVLLERIKEKRLAKSKYYASTFISDTPFDVSETWQWTTLDIVCKKITDGEHLTPPLAEDGVPLLSAKDVRDWNLDFSDTKFICEEVAEKSRARCNPEKNDILVVSRGATVGRTCRVITNKIFCLMGSVLLFKLHQTAVDPGFIELFFKSPFGTKQLTSMSGASAQQAIYIRDMRNFPVPLPPLAEQKEIVQQVQALLQVINKGNQLYEGIEQYLDQLDHSILAKAFRGELVEQDPNDEPASVLLERIRAEREQQAQGKKGKRTMKTASM